jgi:hypothetical protein
MASWLPSTALPNSPASSLITVNRSSGATPACEEKLVHGVWGIKFGNGLSNQPSNTLFFAAGPNDEAHGVYGRIDLNTTSGSGTNTGSSTGTNTSGGTSIGM